MNAVDDVVLSICNYLYINIDCYLSVFSDGQFWC